ncbi:MAG TPA: MaoC family dehydratase [Burkholderiales bacterium]|jgi:acyl dehydratase|nr:MaoC family dehydratase [Burkholderiales bacterium]
MSKPPGRCFEDFEVGARYSTRVRAISDADHEAFCRLVGYEVPLFLDDAYARAQGLPGRICPSHLVMSFSSAMTGDLFAGSVIALLAIENARFLAMVRPGDTIRTEVEVVEKRDTSKPDRGIVVFRDHVYNQEGSEVFRNDKVALLRRRGQESR